MLDRYIAEEMVSWRVREILPNASIIVDTQDLHFLRSARQHLIEEYDYLNQKETFAVHRKSYYEKYISCNNAFEENKKKCYNNSNCGSSFSLGTGEITSECINTLNLPLDELVERYPDLKNNFLRELASIHRADLIFVTSSVERDYLINKFHFNPLKICYAPFYCTDLHSSWKNEFQHRNGFSMLGHFRHAPNADALKTMKYKIWPLIRKSLPDATLSVFGAYPTLGDLELSDPNHGFQVVGPLKQSELHSRLSKFRVTLAPLRYGAGLKGKVIDSLVAGTPVIGSPIAAEGMDGLFYETLSVDPEEFAKAAVTLHEVESVWKTTQIHSINTLKQKFFMCSNESQFIESIDFAVSNLGELRRTNYIGQILWMAKERYTSMFGKYIEMKEKYNINKKNI